ncbi:MAG: type II toxin-antitoxin system HicB family antitoxin [Gemmatimonadaceae bacterium]
MKYIALIERTVDGWSLEFPDLPGLRAEGPDLSHVTTQARAALHSCIAVMLRRGELPPRPRDEAIRLVPTACVAIPLSPSHAVALQLRWIRRERGWTLTDVAKRMGVTRQRIAALETVTHNWQMDTLLRLTEALGADLDIVLHAHPASQAPSEVSEASTQAWELPVRSTPRLASGMAP